MGPLGLFQLPVQVPRLLLQFVDAAGQHELIDAGVKQPSQQYRRGSRACHRPFFSRIGGCRAAAGMEEIDCMAGRAQLGQQHGHQRREAAGVLRRLAEQRAAELHAFEWIDHFDRKPEVVFDGAGQLEVCLRQAAKRDRFDPPSAQLVEGGGHGEADRGQQRLQRRLVAADPRSVKEDRSAVHRSRQLGLAAQHIDQKRGVPTADRLVATQQQHGFAGAQQQPTHFQPGVLADRLELRQHARRDGGGQHRLRCVTSPFDRHVVQPPGVVQLVELAHGLEANKIGQVFVSGGRHLHLPQLDVVSPQRHKGLGGSQSAGTHLRRDTPAELRGSVVGRRLGLAGHGKRLLDHHLPAAARGGH